VRKEERKYFRGMKRFLLVAFLVSLSFSAWGQKEKRFAREGNSLYKDGDFQKAEVEYRRALEKNPLATKVIYNLGNTLYKQNKAEEAVKTVIPVLDSIKDISSRSDVYHNLGNYNLSQKKYQEAIDSYKNSLRERPYDMETKSNLAYAQKMLKNQQDKQKNDQNKDQNNKDNKDQDKKNNKNDNQNKDQKQNPDNKNNPQNQPKINKENADQMLQAIQNKEDQTQDKVKKEKVKAMMKNQPEKNW
jgi:tetratricopeptide (TPR) repeat protein